MQHPQVDQSLPRPPVLTIAVPYATAEYSSSGVFVTYCARVCDETSDLVWQTSVRYSTFRRLHSAVGKHHVASSAFPSLILTAKGNRGKSNIEARRAKLESYMQALLRAVFSPGPTKSVPFHHVARILKFLEYPFVSDWDALLRLSAEGENDSVPSQETAMPQAISALGVDDTPPTTLTTSRWRAPPVVPGPRLGLAMPFATLTQNIEGTWEVLIRGDRGAKKGLLRHRYDECAALAFQLSRVPTLLDPSEAQDFILEFRRKHPITAYMRFERALEAQTPTSLSSRREGGGGLSDSGSHSDHGRHDSTSSEEIGSPVVHQSRQRSFAGRTAEAAGNATAIEASLYVSRRDLPEIDASGHFDARRTRPSDGSAHFALSDTHHLVPLAIIQQEVYQTPMRPKGSGAAALTTPTRAAELGSFPSTSGPHHRDPTAAATARPLFGAGDPLQQHHHQVPAAPGAPVGSPVPHRSTGAPAPNPRAVSGEEKYLSLVRGNKVLGCQCTRETFCSTSGDGDLYDTPSGFTLIVCPPPESAGD